MSAEENRKAKSAEQAQGLEAGAGEARGQPAPGAKAVPGAKPVSGGAQPASGGEAAAETADQRERLAALAAENAALQDQLLRRTAEFENFRKRMFREREEGVRYANAALLADLIPVIDDFERALRSVADTRDFASLHSGLELIERQLVSVLERNWGLKRFSPQSGPAGEKFDPEKHEAVAVEETPAAGEPVVLENYQKGYYLHDRVLRPAKVKVSKPAQTATNGNKE
jgi:molecular chaperone GrpE